MATPQKNSFMTLLEQIAQLNKNSVEVLTKLNDVVGTSKDSVSVDYRDGDGTVSSFQLPTVGWLKKEIDIANSNIEKLSTLEGDNSVVILDANNNSRKIKSVDMHREPEQITNLNISTTFQQNNNWFFDGLLNPTLSVGIDLSGKINESVSKILSRRYIINFEKDEAGNLTSNGQTSLTTFEEKFLNSNNFSIEEFLSWLNLDTNVGVLNKDDENLYKDEQYFNLNYKTINFKGLYSVLEVESDTLNNKLWYHLNTLNYYDRNGGTRTLAVGDVLAINNTKSYTKYKITEINTSDSRFRIIVERIEGYGPIPIGNNTLEYYSSLQSDTKVNITIGYDEYNIVFVKPVNTDNNIIGSSWSKGMSFYSNDLVLNTDSNVSMVDFYLNKVNDFGALLQDLVEKKIPSKLAMVPNKPTPVLDNFKVVQINKHLTDVKDRKTLKKLHSQKNSIKSKIEEVSESITQKNVELNTKVFKSVAEKSKSQNELNKLIKKQESDTKLFASYVSQITNSTVEENALPKFRVRGFWDIPDPILVSGKNQEVICFEIQYKYSSKNGSENTTDGFEIKSVFGTTTKIKQGYFSKWIPLKTDVRKRVFDETTRTWNWEIEDTSDADTPNINQMDISIQKGEKVDIRIRSISEVGYPETPLLSDWSDLISVEFPDDLNDIFGENQFILKEATQEEMRVSFENELSSKGINQHVKESFSVNEQYYAHTDKTVATSFKDSFGNTLSLFDYLKQINDKISALEETIKRAKGELKVILFKGTEETEIVNGATINVVINCEDYMISQNPNTGYVNKSFINNIYLVNDYHLQFENIATENDLGLFTNPSSGSDNTANAPTLISDDGAIHPQYDDQYIVFQSYANIDGVNQSLYAGGGSVVSGYTNVLIDNYKNISNVEMYNSPGQNILSPDSFEGIWTCDEDSYELGSTVHPFVEWKNSVENGVTKNTNTLVDTKNDGLHIIDAQKIEKIPLYVYFKPRIKSETGDVIDVVSTETPATIKKAIRVSLQEESSSRPFEFTIVFKLIRHRQYAIAKDFTASYL